MDLREAKGWSYGVRAGITQVEGQLSYRISAPVQADRTGDAIAALLANYREFLGPKGVTVAELERAQSGGIRELPGALQTGRAVLDVLIENDLLGRQDDHYSTLPARIRALTPATLDEAARAVLDPEQFVWVVVGDAAVVKPQLDKLGLPVEIISLN